MKKQTLILLIVLTALTSCLKKSKNKNIQPSKDYTLMQANLSRIIPLIIQVATSRTDFVNHLTVGGDTINTCASLNYVSGDTLDIAQENVKFNMMFSNCYDLDGHLKNGTVKCNLSDYFINANATCNVTFYDFSIEGHQLNGSVFITKTGLNDYQLMLDNVTQQIGTRYISYSGQVNYAFVRGANDTIISDDILYVIDNGALLDRFGNLSNINNPSMARNLNCSWFSSGLVEIVDKENNTQVLDFGNGSCDNKATITFNDEITAFSME